VIIGPHTILTVSHLLWQQDLGQSAKTIDIFPGYSSGGQQLVTGQWIDHYSEVNDAGDMMTKQTSQNDFAVIDVTANLSSYGSFGIQPDYGGGEVHLTGYPAVDSGLQENQIGSVYSDPTYSVLDYGTIASSPGYSGGPLWINTGTPSFPQPDVVGLVSTTGWGTLLTSADWQTIQGWESSDSSLGSSSAGISVYFGSNTVLNAPNGAYTIYGSGGGAVDTLIYPNALAQYTVVDSQETVGVSNSNGLQNTLINVQQAAFADFTLVFDLHSSEDLLVYELYQAAYNRIPDNSGFRYWANTADAHSLGALTLADIFLQAPEFSQKYGQNPSNSTYVHELYSNVLDRAPDAAGFNYWLAQANLGQPRDQLLVDFATSPENVTLIGQHISNGYWTT
jgi:Domain of unknown function (DUF4214)